MTTSWPWEPGVEFPSCVHHVDQRLINRYAEVSGDHNPLHTDPAFAAGTHFGRTIAHGMMMLAFLSAALESWGGPAWRNGGAIDVTFLSPVYPGEDVIVSGVIMASEEPQTIVCSLACLVADRKIVAGIARWPADHAGEGGR